MWYQWPNFTKPKTAETTAPIEAETHAFSIDPTYNSNVEAMNEAAANQIANFRIADTRSLALPWITVLKVSVANVIAIIPLLLGLIDELSVNAYMGVAFKLSMPSLQNIL
jgi:hypothetical protein